MPIPTASLVPVCVSYPLSLYQLILDFSSHRTFKEQMVYSFWFCVAEWAIRASVIPQSLSLLDGFLCAARIKTNSHQGDPKLLQTNFLWGTPLSSVDIASSLRRKVSRLTIDSYFILSPVSSMYNLCFDDFLNHPRCLHSFSFNYYAPLS